MTNKLYYQDSHMTACSATVRTCEQAADGYEVLLDQTVLFPTGGGQPCDVGAVGGVRVISCREEGSEVFHTMEQPLLAGAKVDVTLNWDRRFDYMQQHTGEHLLSFAFYTLFGAANVGFHLADAYTTIDFDKPLSPQQITEAERLANTCVWRNLSVTATLYATEEDIANLPLRKHAEGLTAPIRIVQIEDADCCTCCAPHCKQTGEVGSIFITDAMSYKGGTRITFLCGGRALSYNRFAHQGLDGIARRFSVSRDKAPEAVAKLQADYGLARRQERTLSAALNRYMADELAAGATEVGKSRLMVALLEGVDPGRLKDLAQLAVGARNALALLFSRYEGKLAYVMAESPGFSPEVSELMPAVNAAVGGKGGGRGALAQGMSSMTAGIEEAVEQVRHYLSMRLRG